MAMALVASACAGRPVSAPSPSVRTTPSSTPTVGCTETSGGTDTEVFLTDVRYAKQAEADRVVFEFEPREGAKGAVPRWSIAFVDPPLRQDPTDDELRVRGSVFASVIMRATGTDLSGAEPRDTYTGPKSIPVRDGRLLREIREGGDFERVLTFYLGMDAKPCFHVEELTDPPRLVVDLRRAS